MKRPKLSVLMILSLSVMAFGCADETKPNLPVMADGTDHGHEHGHSHQPETFVAAVEELVELRNSIRDNFAKKDEDAAHDPLHEVGDLLKDDIGPLIEKAELTGDQLTAVNDAVKNLMESFGAVDKMMHGGEGSTYDEVSKKVDAAVEVLVTASGAKAGGHGHDHDGDHKDGDHDHAAHHKDGEHKDHDAEHKDGDHKDHDGEHKDADPKDHDADHKDGEHKDADPKAATGEAAEDLPN